MGDPDQLHSYSYTPDVAAGARSPSAPHPAAAGADLAPAGRRDPHHPRRSSSRSTDWPATGRASSPPGRTTLRLLGLVKPRDAGVPATPSTSSPTRGSSTTAKFRAAFGEPATPLDDALATTLAWYRDRRTATAVPRPTDPPGDATMNAPRPPTRLAAASRCSLGLPCSGHRRIHRARLGLRVPADPRGADRRHPRPVPRAPGRRHRPGSSCSPSAPP